MDQQQNSETTHEKLVRIFAQMELLINQVIIMSKQYVQISEVLQRFTTQWMTDIERTIDEHTQDIEAHGHDIEALKKGFEFSGKALGAIKKDISELKNK